MKPSINKKRKLIAIFCTLLLLMALGYLIYSQLPGTKRDKRLLDETTALVTFSDIVTAFGHNSDDLNVQSEKPHWEYVKYQKTGKPLFSWDYGHQWQVQLGKIGTTIPGVPTDKTNLVTYDKQLQKLGFSRTPIDRAGQKAGIKKILDQEADPNGYWHKYYEQIDYRRAHPLQTFEQYLDTEFTRESHLQVTENRPHIISLTYYAQLYELRVTILITDATTTTNNLEIELKYGCKEEYDCYE